MDAEGDALLSCAISTSGECMAFGGSGGYAHLWAGSAEPAVNQMGQVRAFGVIGSDRGFGDGTNHPCGEC